MIPPSKALLSALCGEFAEFEIIDDEVRIYDEYEAKDRNSWCPINICKLAQQIKVWAPEQGYLISEIGKYVLIIQKDTGVTKHRIDNDFYEVGDVDWSDLFDISSVFKAGEWVLNQQDKGEV